jgi:hypothetical protein
MSEGVASNLPASRAAPPKSGTAHHTHATHTQQRAVPSSSDSIAIGRSGWLLAIAVEPYPVGDVVLDSLSLLVAAASHAVPLISVLGPLLSGPLQD